MWRNSIHNSTFFLFTNHHFVFTNHHFVFTIQNYQQVTVCVLSFLEVFSLHQEELVTLKETCLSFVIGAIFDDNITLFDIHQIQILILYIKHEETDVPWRLSFVYVTFFKTLHAAQIDNTAWSTDIRMQSKTFISADNSFYVRNKYSADSISTLSNVKTLSRHPASYSSGGVTPRLPGTASSVGSFVDPSAQS